MGELAFHIIVILNGSVHEMAPVKSVACTLLGFVQNITPHLLCRAVLDVDFPTGNFVGDEEKPRTDVFSIFYQSSFFRSLLV